MIPPISTMVDISGFADVRRLALLAHATQVDPTSKFWFGLPPEVLKTVHPIDEYMLARGESGAKPGETRGGPLRWAPRRPVWSRAGGWGAPISVTSGHLARRADGRGDVSCRNG